ncbi:hypothetical protein DTO013E5_5660 [Penicillium roqueforti]|uniref:Genomic scaffold, ProqFM164S02 n=1 Tax=Penicillium roqueforti (strain FM164) TaxID=1365484 RepID=W6Q913_PENRF|nr:uncharacterized protein LCP9604111_9512 [Penicillium roqueforti]CDM33158.1 unnamed protein product [Penicillium roqueforti FM164]KAF9238308.1 hypothetical protein LCP9604111_9512 [Penicillium roqueforti]KAI1830818.1 hypothetical protein CBS147337_8435 [Penicillium roqueforti]KAI2674434.1 hypothetical protein CBS147355_7048 [Penicillium roqueforti]KAI2683906.1 hypothetical protein LCP963914a_5736 [Penicillium roqueforti]
MLSPDYRRGGPCSYFYNGFSGEDFTFCFRFIAEFLDIERTDPAGKFYLRNLWVNLATKVKLWFDSVTAKSKHSAIAHGKW